MVEHVDRTLEHPALRLPPPGGSGSGLRPPPPSGPPGGFRPPPPRDPTVVRTGRRRGRRRLVAGAALLAVGIVAVVVALLQQAPNNDRTVEDPAGISYDVPEGWTTDDSRPPEVLLVEDGATMATVRHQPTDGSSAAAQLEAVEPSVCEDRAGDGPEAGIPGAEQLAMCTNLGENRPILALGAVADGEFWLITVTRETTAAERDEFLESVDLQPRT